MLLEILLYVAIGILLGRIFISMERYFRNADSRIKLLRGMMLCRHTPIIRVKWDYDFQRGVWYSEDAAEIRFLRHLGYNPEWHQLQWNPSLQRYERDADPPRAITENDTGPLRPITPDISEAVASGKIRSTGKSVSIDDVIAQIEAHEKEALETTDEVN